MKGEGGAAILLNWEYTPATQALKISLLPMDYNGGVAFMENDQFVVDALADVSGFATYRLESPAGRETMSNAYGVSVAVEKFREQIFAVAEISRDYTSRLPGGVSSFYTHQMNIPPEEARRLTDDLRLVVLGEVRDFRPGRSVVCGSTFAGATINNPRQRSGQTCVLSAEFASFAFVDSGTGTVIREWR
ncbi:MAG: hypothetical protein K0M78_07815 [Brevundimonas sp.]|nr:hypothetical protein [Brevundimonas sp.]